MVNDSPTRNRDFFRERRSYYTEAMKQIWTGRIAEVAGKYGENAPMATVCCNACRTCVTTNILGLATAGIAGAGYAVARFGRRVFSAKPS
jgi:hypothetical protein